MQQPHPPIYVGGTSNGAIRRAARLGDTWITLPMETLDFVADLVGRYRTECEADAGTKGDDHDPVLQGVAAGEDPPYREFVRDRAFAGTPEIVVDEIRRWHDAIGFDEACLIFATGREATTPEALSRAVTLFADGVMATFA